MTRCPIQLENLSPLQCVSLRKSKIGFLNPWQSQNGFCLSLLNRSIQDLSDHGASKELKNPLWKWILWFLWSDAPWSEWPWINLFKAGVHLKAVFQLGIKLLMQISRLRFKQSRISMPISHIYVLGRCVNFLVIFRYIWR